MKIESKNFQNIDEYISNFSIEIQKILLQIRSTIKEAAPDAEEKISYQIPTFYLNGNLVHFAAHKNHIGFYPTPSGINEFADEFLIYRHGKGTLKFPYDKPLPLELITKVVKHRVSENSKKKKK